MQGFPVSNKGCHFSTCAAVKHPQRWTHWVAWSLLARIPRFVLPVVWKSKPAASTCRSIKQARRNGANKLRKPIPAGFLGIWLFAEPTYIHFGGTAWVFEAGWTYSIALRLVGTFEERGFDSCQHPVCTGFRFSLLGSTRNRFVL